MVRGRPPASRRRDERRARVTEARMSFFNSIAFSLGDGSGIL